MTFSCTFNSELGWRYACSKCCGGRPQKGIWAKGKPWGWRAIKWPGGNSHLVFPKNSWYGMPFAAREGRAGQWGGGGRSPPGLQGQRSAQEPQGQGEGPQGRMDGGALKEGPKGPQPRGGNGSGHAAPSLAYSRYSGQTPPLLPQSPGFQRREASVGVGPGAGAQGLSRRRVPGHLSHRKGSRRRVKVAVKV